jgi:ribosomal protein L29
MKYKELSQKNDTAIRKELAELQAKATDLRQKRKLGQVKNVRELAKVRKDIARILTHLRAN